MALTKAEIKQIADETKDAYSFERYTSWSNCVKVLDNFGLTPLQIKTVLRSKWTRWAADSSNKPYGHATANDLKRFMERDDYTETIKEVRELTLETYGKKS